MLPRVRAFLVIPLLGALGCSGDRITPGPREAKCRQVCEAEKACPEATEIDQRFDCFTYCDDIDAAVRDASCFTRFDRLYACIDQFGICAPGRETCEDRQAGLDDCVAEHCSGNPDIDDCAL